MFWNNAKHGSLCELFHTWFTDTHHQHHGLINIPSKHTSVLPEPLKSRMCVPVASSQLFLFGVHHVAHVIELPLQHWQWKWINIIYMKPTLCVTDKGRVQVPEWAALQCVPEDTVDNTHSWTQQRRCPFPFEGRPSLLQSWLSPPGCFSARHWWHWSEVSHLVDRRLWRALSSSHRSCVWCCWFASAGLLPPFAWDSVFV